MPSELAYDSASPLALDVYRRVAELQMLVATACQDEGCPLNEIQLGLLAATVVQCFDGTEASFASLLTLHAQVRSPLRRRILRDAADPRDTT